MTETAQERDERRAAALKQHEGWRMTSLAIARAIAASDAAVGMDYDALRKLVGEMASCLQGAVDSCESCGGIGSLYGDDQACIMCQDESALVARAREVLK